MKFTPEYRQENAFENAVYKNGTNFVETSVCLM